MRFIKSGQESSKDDSEIISAFRKTKDSLYIGMLFDRYSHLIFAVCMKYLKNEEDSKDCVIQIFEKLPKDLLKYEIRNFSSWIHTVTKNQCFYTLSKNKNYFVDVENIPEQSEDNDDPFITHYLPFLEKALAGLNDEQRICIELFYINNFSYEEVSHKTGYSMLQVKSYIQNGKRNLKIILLNKYNER